MYREPMLLMLLLCCFEKGWGIFLKEPGAVYAVLGYPEYIPCTTSVEPLLYFWYSLDSTGSSSVIIVDSQGVVRSLTESDSFTKSGTDLTLKIKSVGLTEPQVWCQVFVQSDTGPQQHNSSKSNLTITVGCVFEEEPGSAYAVLGYQEDIPCITSVEPLLFFWQAPDSTDDSQTVIVVDSQGVSPAFSEKYSFTKSATDLTLTIKNVSLTEQQVWCQVFVQSDTGLEEHNSKKSNLTITARPYRAPSCSMSARSVSVGDTVTFTCNSAGGLPAASLKLKYTDGTVLNNGPGVKGRESNGRENMVLAHTFKVKKEDDTKTFTCTAENPAITVLHERGVLQTDKLSCSTESLEVNALPGTTTIGPNKPYIVIEGKDAVTNCAAADGKPNKYQYRYRQLTNSWSAWGDSNDKTYSGLNRNKEGEYRCQSKNTAGYGPEDTLTIQVHYPPEGIEITASNGDVDDSYMYIIREGEDLMLDCNAHSNPSASYMWEKDSARLATEEGKLEIEDITRDQKGSFICTATNKMMSTDTGEETGEASKFVSVIVHYKAGRATPTKSSVIVTKDNEVTLECSCSDMGVPSATFTWKKDGRTIKKDSSGQYTINSAQVDKDDGQYQCIPTNSVGSGTAADITVVVHTNPSPQDQPEDTSVLNTGSEFGQDLKCSFMARPAARITWKYNNGTDLPAEIFSWSSTETQSGHENKYTTTESVLNWYPQSNPLNRRHSGGQIKCTADNNVGNPVESDLAKLNIEYAPDIYLTNPRDLKRGAAKEEKVQLVAEVIANPQPTSLLKWQIEKGDSSSDIPAVGYTIENTGLKSMLIIQNITEEQFANYSVTATNKHGSDKVIFFVIAYDVPDEPTDLNWTVTAVSLTAEWNRGWNGALTQVFVLEYQEGAKEVKVKNVKDLVKERYHSVKLGEDDGIKESTEYTVSVFAENIKGKSGQLSRTKTTKAKPTVNTSETTVDHNEDANQATITWSVSAQSFTRVVVKVCNVKEECLSHNITDATDPSTVTVPDGNDLSFSFIFFDGLEQVSEQKDAIKIEPAKTSDNVAPKIGAVVGVIVIIAMIIGMFAFLVWRKRRARGKNEEIHGEGVSRRHGNILRGKLKLFRAGRKEKTTAEGEAKIYERTNPTYVNEHMEEAEYARLDPASSSAQAESAYEEVEMRSRECSPDAIKLGRVLHKGAFSEVFNGTVQNLPGFKHDTRVIVKLPRAEAPVFEQSMVVNDIKALKSVGQHGNVIKLLAQCIHKDPVMAVFAIEENGTLRTYLQKQRDKLSVHDEKQRVFIAMVQDVLNGMAYLDSLRLRILHRCVCADHVLVDKTGVCKVSGFGFSSDVLEREEYERSQGIEVTLRWVAPEQVSHHEHTCMSDVWSFGVLVWEMFNYGVKPYSDMTGDEAKQCILSGGMLGHPADATYDVFDIMQKCWEMNPEGRPKIGSLLKMLNRQNAG